MYYSIDNLFNNYTNKNIFRKNAKLFTITITDK